VLLAVLELGGNMRKLATFTLAVISTTGALMAAPISCSSGNPQNVLTLNSTEGCTFGGLTFNNFQVLPAGGNPNPEVDLVSAVFSDGFVSLQFNPNISAPPSGGNQDIHFFFTVAGGVDQVDLSVGGVNATIAELVCKAAISTTNPTCATGNTLENIVAYSAGPNSVTSMAFAPTGLIYVYKDIGVSPNSPSSAGGALTNFNQSFHFNGNFGPLGDVPEPFTSALFGSGLAALGIFRRKLK